MNNASKTEFNTGAFQFVDPELLIENEEILVWQRKKYQTVSKCFLLFHP